MSAWSWSRSWQPAIPGGAVDESANLSQPIPGDGSGWPFPFPKAPT
jgi:hypothetical protein